MARQTIQRGPAFQAPKGASVEHPRPASAAFSQASPVRSAVAPVAGATGQQLDRRLRRAQLLGHRPPLLGHLSQRHLSAAVQRVVELPTADEEPILGDMTTFLRDYRNRLGAPGINLPQTLAAGKRALNAVQDVILHSMNPGNPGQTLHAYIGAQNFNIALPGNLANARALLTGRIFTDANTTFAQVPRLSDHLQPLLTAAWNIHTASEQGTTVVAQTGSEDVGLDYTAGGGAPACLGVNLGAPPTLADINNNAGVAANVARVQTESTSRITWHFPDGSSIAVDIPGGGNENFQVSYLPHIHLVAPDGTPLTPAGIGVPKASEPAHVLLHWTTYGLTQSIRAISGQQGFTLPDHLRAIGRYP